MVMRITFRQLEVFIEILQCGSTIQAAQSLALSQSAVSAALTDLESQLEVQLFDRVGKRLVTNEYGRLLYPKVLALLEQATEVEQIAKNGLAAVKVAASTTIGNYILPGKLVHYRHDNPTIPFELTINNTAEVIKAVLEFKVDLGLIEGSCYEPELITIPWKKDQLVVFCSPNNPLVGRQLKQHELENENWILRESGSGTRNIVDQLLLSKLSQCNILIEFNNSEAIKHAVINGMGISCLSYLTIEEQLKNGSLVALNIDELELSRTLYLIHHQNKHLSKALLLLLEYFQ
jgi:DNA-binding transcriptional LysR family regulator